MKNMMLVLVGAMFICVAPGCHSSLGHKKAAQALVDAVRADSKSKSAKEAADALICRIMDVYMSDMGQLIVCTDAEHFMRQDGDFVEVREHVAAAAKAGCPWVILVVAPDSVQAMRTAKGELWWRWEVHLLEVAGAPAIVDHRSTALWQRRDWPGGQTRDLRSMRIPAFGHVVDTCEWRGKEGQVTVSYRWRPTGQRGQKSSATDIHTGLIWLEE